MEINDLGLFDVASPGKPIAWGLDWRLVPICDSTTLTGKICRAWTHRRIFYFLKA
jgi:hypothetical protein